MGMTLLASFLENTDNKNHTAKPISVQLNFIAY